MFFAARGVFEYVVFSQARDVLFKHVVFLHVSLSALPLVVTGRLYTGRRRGAGGGQGLLSGGKTERSGGDLG